MKNKQTIAVWFSCGAASAVAAMLTVLKYKNSHNIVIVNNPVKEEDDDNLRFLKDVSEWIGHEIIIASNSNYPTNSAYDVWEKRKYMSGVTGAPCTKELKKEARYQFEKKMQADGTPIDWHVLGFTAEEEHRHKRFTMTERENVLPMLIDSGYSKQDCFRIIEDAGIELPRVYKMGYPNANCIGCVKSTGVTYWNHVRKMHPEVFAQRAEQSRRLGVRLVRYKGKRLFLDELPEDAKGNNMKSYECGIFCRE